MKSLRVAIAQTNPLVGDLKGNSREIAKYIKKAAVSEPDIVIFPELALCGYPPEDLILKLHFRKDCKDTLKKLIKNNNFKGLVFLGYIEESRGSIYNSVAVIKGKRVVANYRKICLPNYGVFDERRYFSGGNNSMVISLSGIKVAITICEDIWADNSFNYRDIWSGVDVIINVSASPYHMGKFNQRKRLLEKISIECKVKIIYVNQVGAQDELVFDGASMVVDDGSLRVMARQFKEDMVFIDLDFKSLKRKKSSKNCNFIGLDLSSKRRKTILPRLKEKPMDELKEVYSALEIGVKDYVRKNGFSKVVIGLSGGIDSSLVAAIAKDGLGSSSVLGVIMPSAYSSKSSIKDAQRLAMNLGIKSIEVPIGGIYGSYIKTMKPFFKGLKFDKAEENIQARIRGNILMALSNKFGYLVLTTGNKSEVSVGYCTLYGDMAGGFAVIKDLTKTLEYKLAKWRNSLEKIPLIPLNVIKKAPSAELRPNQKDQDTLPPYSMLDDIVLRYIEEDMSFDDMVRDGFNKHVVKRVIKMIDDNEYKRRQSPPGIKITPKSFGKDRRMPITSGYRI
ncbi:MAG: NAD+ synthase [Candidatus Kaelpia imicola]|nr:NAD+ synthase [Candidatus Kaelpia imicola]